MSVARVHSQICNQHSETTRVLLLEDNSGYADIVKIMLDKIPDARFDVTCARRLSEGLKCLDEGEVDLILLDLKLPDSRGIETFDRVQALTPRVPIIVLTVTDNDELAVAAVRKGAQDYLVKDQVDGKLLVRAIRYAIERKRMEEQLREANAFLQNILNTSTAISIVCTDLQGNIRFWNKGAEAIFGYKAEEVIGRQNIALLYPDDDEKTKKTVAEVKSLTLNSKQEVTCEIQEVTKNGSKLWINMTCTPRLDERGHVVGILGIGKDYTQRKQMQEALISSETRFRTMIENNADGIIIVDGEGVVRFVNPAAEAIFARRAEEFIDTLFGFPLAAGEKPELDIVRKNGAIVAAEMRVVETEWKDEPAYLISIRDITDRKQTEKQLRGQALIFENIHDGIIVTDLEGKIISRNPAAERMFDYDGDAIMHKTVGELATKIVTGTLHDDRWTGEINCTGKGGTKGIYETSVIPLRDENANITSVFGVFHDITQAKEIDRMKSELVSNVSHELRTPLSIVKEGISLVVDGSLGSINADQKEVLAMSKSDIDRLARLINDLLDISKIEAGRMKLKKTMVDISLLAVEVFFTFKGQAEKKGIKLETTLKEDMPSLYCDPDKVTQILTNLISNSIKFTPEDGSIMLSIEDKGESVEISIADTGVGISPENIDGLFDRFSQFDRVYGPGEKGTGLGLAISKEIVEMHGGRIWVRSTPAKGSTFTFSLPRLDQDEIFHEYLVNGLREAEENDHPLSLIVVHMKHIERIERDLGGQKTTKILQEIERLIEKTLRRKSDIVSRYKYGELIIAILMDTARGDAFAVRERIRQAIATEIQEKGWPKGIELSLDVVSYPDDAVTEEEWINKISQGLWDEEIAKKRS